MQDKPFAHSSIESGESVRVMTVGLLICFTIALAVGALLWLAVSKARERLAAHHRRARLQAC
jgi:hypothetical protein